MGGFTRSLTDSATEEALDLGPPLLLPLRLQLEQRDGGFRPHCEQQCEEAQCEQPLRELAATELPLSRGAAASRAAADSVKPLLDIGLLLEPVCSNAAEATRNGAAELPSATEPLPATELGRLWVAGRARV